MKEVESNFWLCIVISHSNLFVEDQYSNSQTISSLKPLYSIFKEEDAFNLIDFFYEQSYLFNGSFTKLFKTDSLFEHILQDFTKTFLTHYFSQSCSNFFNNINFWGFKIIPLNEKLFLYASKQFANLQI